MSQYRISPLVVVLANVLLFSCTSFGPTRPNVSILDSAHLSQSSTYTAEAHTILASIASQNELLAYELGKLPELQGGIDQKEIQTLGSIRSFYMKYPKSFDEAFAKMYMVGIPDVRKYCTPLQATFWLAEEDYFSYDFDVLENYSLQNLINLAWSSGKSSIGRMLRIIDEYRSDDDRKDALALLSKSSLEDIRWKISQDYHSGQDKFTETGKQYVLQEMNDKDDEPKDPRWSDYQTVVERINSPALFNLYINKFITYRGGHRAHGAAKTFATGVGHCTDAAYLAEYMMKRAGYTTFMRSVRWGPSDWHEVHTASGIIMEDGSYLLVADFGYENFTNSLGGPYKTLDEVDSRMTRGRTVIHSAWGAYFPPP